jgi:hypothetical protein
MLAELKAPSSAPLDPSMIDYGTSVFPVSASG